MDYFMKLLQNQGVKSDLSIYLSYVILSLIILLVCMLFHIISKLFISKILTHIINKNKIKWDNILLNRKVFHRVAHLIPATIIYICSPLYTNEIFQEGVRRLASSYALVFMVLTISAIIDSINDIYQTYPISKVRPIKGLLQVIKIIIFILSAIILIAILMDKDPLILISSIGALAAVFSFVFKDSILGFIAGIQLTSNDMLRIGDWIEMTKFGADGDVVDITLNTVKVQNFDKTFTTIPAYALVSDSFKNWRGMKDFGGRRIKRFIYIDVNSIGFCTPEQLEEFKKIDYLREYIIHKEREIEQYNKENNVGSETLVNGRHLTNVGTFRIYCLEYLKRHPRLHNNYPPMVRQLPLCEYGLPLEIYAFTNDTVWSNYEAIQSDIFDHIISVTPYFGIRIFQNPSGHDFKEYQRRKQE